MAVTAMKMGMIVAALGLLSFACGIVAEIKKAPAGEPIQGKGVVICNNKSNLSVILGYISVVFLLASTGVGYYSVFYPYKGKSIPRGVACSNRWFISYFHVTLGTTGLALVLLLWPTITENLNIVRNVHKDLQESCPTVESGLIGGAAFMSLNSSLFWLVDLMLISNVREDYFEEAGMDDKSLSI